MRGENPRPSRRGNLTSAGRALSEATRADGVAEDTGRLEHQTIVRRTVQADIHRDIIRHPLHRRRRSPPLIE